MQFRYWPCESSFMICFISEMITLPRLSWAESALAPYYRATVWQKKRDQKSTFHSPLVKRQFDLAVQATPLWSPTSLSLFNFQLFFRSGLSTFHDRLCPPSCLSFSRFLPSSISPLSSLFFLTYLSSPPTVEPRSNGFQGTNNFFMLQVDFCHCQQRK